MNATQQFDAIIIGGGFAGLYMLLALRRQGQRVCLFESGDDIGGTWFWNTYPGARCDVESFEYSYSFDSELQQEWCWSERYATQPEILDYIFHVADRHDLRRDIRCATRVTGAHWDAASGTWQVQTNTGVQWAARFVILATGCLSQPNIPAFPGMADFRGTLVHSSRWPRTGLGVRDARVGVIGTGSSGVQVIGNIAAEVRELRVYQRHPHWIIPAGNRSVPAAEASAIKADYPALRRRLAESLLGMGVAAGGGNALDVDAQTRRARYEACWQAGGPAFLMAFDDLLFDLAANATACDFLAEKIRALVHDSATADALIPDPARFPVGARRLVMSDRYYESFNLPHVALIDTLADPVAAIEPDGIRLASGSRHALDIIVLATGFDAMTGALLDLDIRGAGGKPLAEAWADGPRSYLGLASSGFPNCFTLTGPGSPSVFSNVVLSIEQHVEFVAALLGWMAERRLQTIEAEPAAEAQWGAEVRALAEPTVFMHCDSWYWGSNVSGKPRSFLPYLGGVGRYREHCNSVASSGYPGFVFT